MRSKSNFKSWHAVVAGTILLALLACGFRPPLRITNGKEGVDVDVQTMGEYPTSISRVVIVDTASEDILWELRAGREGAQLARFRLVPGENPVIPLDVAHGFFEVMMPLSGTTFQLQEGVTYEIRVWGQSGRPRVARFRLE